MRRDPITAEQLRLSALDLLERLKTELLETGNITPSVLLVDPLDGTPDMLFAFQGDLMNSGTAKDAISVQIKTAIRDHGFSAALSAFDTWLLKCTEEQAPEMFALRRLGLDSRQIAALGIGTLQETLYLSIETMDGRMLQISQPYVRDPEGQVVDFLDVDEGRATMARGRFHFFGEGS